MVDPASTKAGIGRSCSFDTEMWGFPKGMGGVCKGCVEIS
jgi:hypothetical protein